MLSNVKKKDVPLIVISLAAIVFIAATLSLFPNKPPRRLIRFLTASPACWVPRYRCWCCWRWDWCYIWPPANTAISGSAKAKPSTALSHGCLCLSAPGSAPLPLYWGVAEWAYYYQTPGLNIAPHSAKALEYSIPYSFFHWGISAWATYTLASLIMAYHFHVRKNKGLSLSGIISAITGVNPQGLFGAAWSI